MTARSVEQVVVGVETTDGAGVRLKRSIGTPSLLQVDPFLLLDEFRSDDANDYIAGFPDHPHRGFETVTYMLAGRMRHRDSRGNEGLLDAGSVQWMTAGRGIVHSEMPEQEEGLLRGFQLWVNLPASSKMTEPRYQDIPAERVPEVVRPDGVRVRIIAGRAGDVAGPVSGISVDPTYLDVTLPEGSQLLHPLPVEHAAFCYVFEGSASIGTDAGTAVDSGHVAVLGEGGEVRVRAASGGARLLLVAGRPLREPIARHGPFVMNTESEIRQALRDLQSGNFL
jgi:redox-sensitive bicupin YhaK (pirin superfamily)